ncbi:MAG: hypothetical protein IT235_07005 [Bacteroidia bacterium]|nr:hypothetical protein [Bacteroidia bacterium]
METENSAFEFLTRESAAKYFAETDFTLKQGRHIQQYGVDSKLFDYLYENHEDLGRYYEQLFGVYLRKESNDREEYFYLAFPEDGHGRFVKDRYKELDPRHVIFGILLLNVYRERMFEKKEMKWENLEQLFDESESRELWQKLLYGEVKRNYTPHEKEEVKRRVEHTLNLFDKLGWIQWIDSTNIHFEIMPSIDRISKLYANEIQNVELISEYVQEQIV